MATKNDFGALFNDSGSKKAVFYQKSGEKMFEIDAVLAIILGILMLFFVFWVAIIVLILILADVFYFEVLPKDITVADSVEEPKSEN
jgi:hypothetical protein